MKLLRTTNALNLQDFLEHFELTLLCILHPRYNSTPAENRMSDTFSLKITDKIMYFQHPDRSRYDSTDFFRIKKQVLESFLTILSIRPTWTWEVRKMQGAIFSHSIHGDSLESFLTILSIHSIHGDKK